MSPAESVRQAQEASLFLRDLKRTKVPVARGLRHLTEKEIDQLARQGNVTTGDWSQIWVAQDFTPRRIWQNTFFGKVEIGAQTAEFAVNGIKRKAGIYNSVIFDARIEENVFIKGVSGISNYLIQSGAAVSDCGSLQVSPGCDFFNGAELDEIGVETGGRGVRVYAEMTLELAAHVMTHRTDKAMLEDYAAAVKDYAAAAASDWGVVGRNARILNTNKVHNVYIGESGEINNAVLVENATLLSGADEPARVMDGAYVKDAVVQWGAEVGSMGILTQSVLIEHSHVAFHGKVHQSVIGANSGVAKGEITSSLVGPFVGFHHQSLLIAAFWPEGKGNVAYGANVGSNHTSRAPDQEILPGEGVFFGLGSSVKFPANLSKAPYSIIATNVSTLPQRVEFPFSLINLPGAGLPDVSPAFNEILPGWVLSDNLFAIRRNEWKYRKRNKARRARIEFAILRPAIIDMMRTARDRLSAVSPIAAHYTGREIRGLGKNYLTEEWRRKGVEIYGFFIRYYVFTELFLAEKHGGAAGPFTDHARALRQAEFPDIDLPAALRELMAMNTAIAKSVLDCRSKDDVRGRRIIDDYASAHRPAEEDAFIRQSFEEAEKANAEIGEFLKR